MVLCVYIYRGTKQNETGDTFEKKGGHKGGIILGKYDCASESANCRWNFSKIYLFEVPLFQCCLRPLRNSGNMKEKCVRLLFGEGEKSGGTFNRREGFEMLYKRAASPGPLSFREKFCAN